MINRVTENIKFDMLTSSVFNIQGQVGELEEKLTTQKTINRPSDDPIGTNDILDFRTTLNAIEQYQTNIADADISLSITETALSSIKDVIAEANAIAISEASSGSTETMDISAATVSALIDEALSLMNTKNGDSYLFAGSSTNTQPFSATYSSASIGAVTAASTNTFDGTVTLTSGSAYTGTENKTYALKITGGTLTTANYEVSSDGGKTWTASTIPVNLSAPATIAVGDGISIDFTAATQVSAGDIFTVKGTTGGYYSGNDDNMSVLIGKNNSLVYNITGADAFTGPTASATVPDPLVVVGAGDDLTVKDTIVLTRDAANWSLKSNPNYSDMHILSQNASTVTIDAGTDGIADITLSLSGQWNVGDTATFTITPENPITIPPTPLALSAVSVLGTGTVDLLGTLYTLKDALSAHNTDLISAQTARLQTLETQVLQSETLAGAKRNSLEVTSNNHDSLDLQVTNMLADVENADLTKLIIEFQMKQIAMQASYSMASKIGKMTIMDYI